MRKLKGVFKPLKGHIKINFNKYDIYPVLWCSIPHFIHIVSRDVMWKDKYDTPRFENVPYIWIHIFIFNFIYYWGITNYDDEYWEQALWYLYYSGTITQELGKVPNIEIARKNWPWQDHETKKSTWNDSYLINY